ncbi:hypothetical protein FUA48_12295 [Flavobacterium alkalisoli]|uniref:Porin family protein n=1 Tax=Flavobacterium alkalisoli TaxID=2602769 RepID=A0A5B9FVI0_9FLAO|nr:DUF6646 family protein [Flavobacterium alkalisoli]QEE50329.1 hypothetical protein FUA48_12295 [Flavobacterium alkalisoli]
MKKIIVVAALFAANFLSAQAFNGKGDTKLQIGATLQDGGSGIAGTVDFGLGDNLSFGFQAGYMLGADEILGEKADFVDRVDAKVRLNANLSDVIGLEQLDVYPGLNLGIHNFGAHLGFRYFFTDGFGLYTESSIPIATYKSSPEGFDKYNNQFIWQIGASFNL